MLTRLSFGQYTPDTPLGIDVAANVIVTPTGYRPSQGFSPVTSALAGILGGASFSSNDTRTLLGGTASNLYVYGTSSWVSVIDGLSAASWRFDQFGDNVICVNGGAPIAYSISAGTAAVLGGSPPLSDIVATVRDQVFLAGDTSATNTVAISGYNDSAGWAAGVNQCLYVPFPSGGDIMGICGGETGIILQRRSVRRATYNGDGVTWWQFDEIGRDIGCMAKGSVAQAGTLVFYLSDQGFMVCDRNQVTPIGIEAVDRTFFGMYSRQDIVDQIRAAVDPRDNTVSWSMPGNPGKVWRYNWALKQWSPPFETPNIGIFQGYSRDVTLEGIDALYPDGIETVPYSLDSTMFEGGDPLLFIVNPAGVVGTLTGDNADAYISLAPQEIDPGKRVRITAARIVGDVTAGTVTIDARARAGDSASLVKSGAMRANGRVPLRANGRHMGVRVDIPASDWSYANGIDIEYVDAGVW